MLITLVTIRCDSVPENRVGRKYYHTSLQHELALTLVRSTRYGDDGYVDRVSTIEPRMCPGIHNFSDLLLVLQ